MKAHHVRRCFEEASNDDERTRALHGSEQAASEELVDFLIPIATDETAFDLTRIEAIKALGLSVTKVCARADAIVDTLIKLANEDGDEDVQNYALMSLQFHAALFDPERIASTIGADRDSNTRYSALAILEKQLVPDGTSRSRAARRVLESVLDDPELGDDVRDVLGD